VPWEQKAGVSLGAYQRLLTATRIVVPIEGQIPNPDGKAPSIIERFGLEF
jgi:hypothetical protein